MSLSCHTLSRPNNKQFFPLSIYFNGITKILTKVSGFVEKLRKKIYMSSGDKTFFSAILLICVKYKLKVIAGIHFLCKISILRTFFFALEDGQGRNHKSHVK